MATSNAEHTSWNTNPFFAIFLPIAMDFNFPVKSGFSLYKSAAIILFCRLLSTFSHKIKQNIIVTQYLHY